MSQRATFLLSPYRPPTSYPVTLAADEAAAWLNGYFALWHPAALMDAPGPPVIASAYDHDLPLDGALYVVPEGPQLFQADDWPERVQKANAHLIRPTADAAATRASLLAALNAEDVYEDVATGFAAVGYGYLVLETLCEAMSHDRLLDAGAFWADVHEAARSLADPWPKLRDAAAKLLAARESMVSGTIRLMDWIALRDDTLGAPWPTAVCAGAPVALLTDVETLAKLKHEHPARFAELSPQVEVACGAFRERDDAFLLPESQFWNLLQARNGVRELTGNEPASFARTRSAFGAQSPSWLLHAGYANAIAANFDGSLMPTRYASVVHWPAPDGRSIEAATKEPLNAADPSTFFNLGYYLHQATTHDAAPTLTLLHKGQPPAVGYDAWRMLATLAPVHGEWVALTRYFADVPSGDYTGAASPDDFFTDALDERVSVRHRPDPVSGFAAHARLRRRLDSAFALAALHQMFTPSSVADLEALEDAIETRGADVGPAPDELSAKLQPLETHWAHMLAERIQARAAENVPGALVFNPCGFTRRVALELADFPGPVPLAGAVKASEFADGTARVVVEVPALGFAWFPRGGGTAMPPKLVTADGTTVRNEFLEAELDPVTGGLRAIRDARTRVNRLGQMLAFQPGSTMKATSVRATHAGAALGEVVSEGVLVDEHGEPLADFRQRLRAWVGRPALELRIELTPRKPPAGYAWHAYYAARFAWRDERTAIFRGTNGSTTQSGVTRPCTPDFIELRFGTQRSFVFTGGLPFVQKQGGRMFDVVLVPEGETATTFDMLIAFDREHPMQTAAGWYAPAPVVHTTKGTPHVGASGWLAHVDLPSLLLTSLRPAAPTEGANRAVTMRFLETAGYGGSAEVRFARDPNRAYSTDAAGVPTAPLAMSGDAIPIEFSANEAITLRAEWT